MVTPPDSDNGRVTLAVLGAKLDSLSDKLDDLLEKQDLVDRVVHEHSVQIASQCQRLDGRIDKTVADLGGKIDRVEDRQRGWTAGQGILTILAASIAAWLGMRP